jgi:hypothetical protein
MNSPSRMCDLDGLQITLSAAIENGQPVVIASQLSAGEQVAIFSLRFDMKSYLSAVHFVDHADTDTFRRAANKLAESRDILELFENGLTQALIQPKSIRW